MSLFFRLFAGVSKSEMIVFPLVPLGCWMLPIGIYILLISFQLGRRRQNWRFVVIRYGMLRKWWKKYFFQSILYAGMTAAALLFLFGLPELFLSKKSGVALEEVLVIFVLWTVHTGTSSAAFLFMETLKIRKAIPAFLLLLDGFTFLGGYYIKEISGFMYGYWGMYVQSSLYERRYGFPVGRALVIEIVIIAVCYLAGRCVLQRKETEGVYK